MQELITLAGSVGEVLSGVAPIAWLAANGASDIMSFIASQDACWSPAPGAFTITVRTEQPGSLADPNIQPLQQVENPCDLDHKPGAFADNLHDE